jgi:CO/xanthine dehydrogenase Mo-binding subunit
MNNDGSVAKFGVGQPVRRFGDHRLLTGKGRFQDDIVLPRLGMPATSARVWQASRQGQTAKREDGSRDRGRR